MIGPSLTAAVLYLATVWVGPGGAVYAKPLRQHELGAVGRAGELARYIERAATSERVNPWLLLALVYLESSFRTSAVHPSTGAAGLGQLNPRGKHAVRLMAACSALPSYCEALSVSVAASALLEGLQTCAGTLAGVGYYRTGRCVVGPRARYAVRLAERLERRFGVSRLSDRTECADGEQCVVGPLCIRAFGVRHALRSDARRSPRELRRVRVGDVRAGYVRKGPRAAWGEIPMVAFGASAIGDVIGRHAWRA